MSEALSTRLQRKVKIAPNGHRSTALNYEHPTLGSVHVHWSKIPDVLAVVVSNDSSIISLSFRLDDNLHCAKLHQASSFGYGPEQSHHKKMIFGLAIDTLFATQPQCTQVEVPSNLQTSPNEREHFECFGSTIFRDTFYQQQELWSVSTSADSHSLELVNNHQPPQRPKQPTGEFYRRHIPTLHKTLSFRTIHPEQDLDLFHNWMNQRRVAKMWELDKPKEELHQYLVERQQDSHIFSVIGEFDGEPFGYFEIYWTKEDRLGPYYDAGDYDRGFHLLVGNTRFLGLDNFIAWFSGLTHAVFLLDRRTPRVMGEPRADNRGLLQYTQILSAYRVLKEFDFPHKRAALVECTRQRFFNQTILP
ncbi:GNAT family N-acetyltransferase [Aurantivibrio plasticivorans]